MRVLHGSFGEVLLNTRVEPDSPSICFDTVEGGGCVDIELSLLDFALASKWNRSRMKIEGKVEASRMLSHSSWPIAWLFGVVV